MTVPCTQLRQKLKEVPRAQKWALAHAGVRVILVFFVVFGINRRVQNVLILVNVQN